MAWGEDAGVEYIGEISPAFLLPWRKLHSFESVEPKLQHFVPLLMSVLEMHASCDQFLMVTNGAFCIASFSAFPASHPCQFWHHDGIHNHGLKYRYPLEDCWWPCGNGWTVILVAAGTD